MRWQGMPALRIILLKSSTVTVLSIGASLLLAVTVVPALGGVVDGNAWLMCVLCPLFIAFPVSTWQFFQASRLRMANDEIARLHLDLAAAHQGLIASHAELAERARRDGLTNLLNREGFLAALRDAIAEDPVGVLLVLDADHFKTINDRFGHPVGDAALRAIGGVITSATGQNGLGGRIGGEEFAVYLPGADLTRGAAMAEHLRQAVAALELKAESGEMVPLSVSIGAASRAAEPDLTALVAAADRQLYRAKRRGRNRVALPAREKAAA
jgi:diguanylate cyclase (GGDEF)-like protein